VALRRLGVLVRHDIFQDRLIIDGLAGCGPLLDDRAMERLWLTIDERFRFRPGKDFFWTVVGDEARQHAYHPVCAYLASLKWDGVPRIDKWLTTYGGAESTPYTDAVGALALVAAVRRVRQPGCKFDEMVVLESAQGTDKSTALRTLAVRDEWFSDDLPLGNADGKRVIEALAGRWIVEAAELNGMRKGDVDHLKASLSRTHDRARMSYDRLVTEAPRQCVIMGTTNSAEYLRDSTGNRRFWPVSIKRFDIDALRRDRDQLWAEAAAREAQGASIRLDPSLWAAAADEQAERRIADPWEEMIVEHLLGREGKLKVEDAWKLVGVPEGQRTQEHNRRLGEAMRKAGWDRTRRRARGDRSYVYCKGRSESWIRVERNQHGGVSACYESGSRAGEFALDDPIFT
jgi:predicted P-loop ATPase